MPLTEAENNAATEQTQAQQQHQQQQPLSQKEKEKDKEGSNEETLQQQFATMQLNQQQHDPSQQQQNGEQQQQQQPQQQPQYSQLQLAQLQQLQFQQMQWQYLQQLQQQQYFLQQQQQAQQQGQFDPTSNGETNAADGSSQYRSAYQSYGAYPTQQQQDPNQQQQYQPVDENGNPILLGQPNQQSDTNSGAISGSRTTRSRYHPSQAPSYDPKAWNDSVMYPSKSNPDRYLTHRNYFSAVPQVINRLPRKPELKELVMRGRDFYTNNRDPRFYNPIQEAGWDNRAAVVKVKITTDPMGQRKGRSETAYQNTSGGELSTQMMMTNGVQNWRYDQAMNGGSTGVGIGNGNSGTMFPPINHPPNLEEAKEQFQHFPVLVDNHSASITRPGSKLLVPFLHNWPPPFRFDYLKKHSRAPLSPFLASLNGYDVPPELFMTQKQKGEMERMMQEHQQMMMQQQQQGGEDGNDGEGGYDPQQQQQQQGMYDPYGNWIPIPPTSQHHLADATQSSDPIERARARANTHTTYWRSVAPQAGIQGQGGQQEQHHHASGGRSGARSTSPTRSRPEWNYRHHLVPPPPRVGQSVAPTKNGDSKKGGGGGGGGGRSSSAGRREKMQQKMIQEQQQQQQMMMYEQQYQQQFAMFQQQQHHQQQPYPLSLQYAGQLPPLMQIPPHMMMQQQQQQQNNIMLQSQPAQSYFYPNYSQATQQHDASEEGSNSTSYHPHPGTHLPPEEGAPAPGLSSHTGPHVRDVYEHLYPHKDAGSTSQDGSAASESVPQP